jgi:hypothetical protein
MPGIQRVHAVEHPQERGLSAAGGADERRDTAVAERQVDVLQRVRLAVVEIEVADLELHRVRRGIAAAAAAGADVSARSRSSPTARIQRGHDEARDDAQNENGQW